jgi:DNA-binding transcriptional LysR family regulator
VSHAVRRLESAIGLKLLNRTSRRVTTTDAGEKLLAALHPGFDLIESRIEELRQLRGTPRGLVRITTSRAATQAVLWPKLSRIVRDYPEIQFEVSHESRVTDLAEDRFDAGVRLREFVAPDMIAVPIGPPVRLAVVAAPEYFRERGVPEHPDDLDQHACLALRFQSHAAPYDWEFERDGKEIVKKVFGPFVFSDSDMCVQAAKEAHGIACVIESEVDKDIKDGRLRRVLQDWCQPFDGFCLCYYESRRVSSAFRLVVDRLRYREPQDSGAGP